MHYITNCSYRGYSHIKQGKPCQDYSLSFKDNERYIVAVADGHGGQIYIRSEIGAKYACLSLFEELKSIKAREIRKNNVHKMEEKIKISLLCRWNNYIESHFAKNKYKQPEFNGLNENQIDLLKEDFIKAYGTTLTGILSVGKYLIIVSIGDTEILGIKHNELNAVFDTEDDPAGNVTNSLCQEDAFNHLKLKICLIKDYDAVILCTDGLSAPYQDYENFNKSFVQPSLKTIRKEKTDYKIQKIIEEISLKFGTGDDVSLGLFIRKI